MLRSAGPPWLELLGHYLGWLPNKLGFFEQAPRKYGDVVDLSLAAPWRRTYLLNDPADIQHVLRGNHLNYDKTWQLTGAQGRQRSGEGLLTGAGTAAVQQKRLLQPILAQSIIPRLGEIVGELTPERLDRWGDAIDASAEMSELARRILAFSLFGEDFSHSIAEAIEERQRFLRRVYESLWPAGISRTCARALALLDGEIYRQIDLHRRQPRLDLLSMFIAARFSDGSGMSDKQLRDETLTMMATGYDTVAISLAWTLYVTAHYPDFQSQMQDPQYASQVYSEALRLYPPTWIFVRVVQHDDRLPGGFELPARSKLFLSPYVTQRDERYFPQPLRFSPERFARPGHRPAYFPFSAGPRICLGQGFAMLVATRILSEIARRYRWQSEDEVKPRPGQFLFPHRPVRLRLVRVTA